ncbi:MAG: response regulator [Hydrogenophilales bacterium]|nr:response regulator [Hydrogenophilales bacterium]
MAKRVLIVDDQSDLRKLIRMTLESVNYELHEAEDGVSALEQIPPLWPDLLVLDIMMPGPVDGLALCGIVKQRPEFGRIKVLLLSAKGQRADLDRGRHAGADGYLVKPFSPLELIQTVDRLLA